MKECTQQYFEEQLKELQNNPQSGLSGPFSHAAPKGNMFRGPFREHAWMENGRPEKSLGTGNGLAVLPG